jgi:hypothetical protein
MEIGPRSSLWLLGGVLLTVAGLAAIAIGIIIAMPPADRPIAAEAALHRL